MSKNVSKGQTGKEQQKKAFHFQICLDHLMNGVMIDNTTNQSATFHPSDRPTNQPTKQRKQQTNKLPTNQTNQ